MMGIIDTLRAEGTLVLLHDYRAGHCRDLSGNGNHGTPTDVVWSRDGALPIATTSRISVPDSDELQLVEGALIVFGPFAANISNERLIVKRDAGGTNFSFYKNDTSLLMYDGAGISNVAVTTNGKKCLAVNFESGEKFEAFADGVSQSLSAAAMTFTKNDAPISIGNRYNDGMDFLHSTLSAVLIVNRKLTATEHAAVYAELAARRWPTQHTRRWSDWLGTGASEGWGADYAIHETPNVAPGSFIGQWEVLSGAFKVEVQDVDGEQVKVIECTNDGLLAMLHPEADDEFAYGTWDFWLYKGGTLTHPDLLIAAATKEGPASVTQYTYMLTLGSLENVILKKYIANVGTTLAASDIGYIGPTGWVHLKLTRSAGNAFTVYVNGELMDVTGGSGTNPVTDAAVTDGKYLVCDFKTGDRIAWAGVNRPFFSKSKGVI
jgi:hypothetical protein